MRKGFEGAGDELYLDLVSAKILTYFEDIRYRYVPTKKISYEG
jgi:hypothetical protein